jgi:hypothetical protein
MINECQCQQRMRGGPHGIGAVPTVPGLGRVLCCLFASDSLCLITLLQYLIPSLGPACRVHQR